MSNENTTAHDSFSNFMRDARRRRERAHLHCPEGCEHPQPFEAGQLILCGLCFHVRDLVTPMVDCGPEICG